MEPELISKKDLLQLTGISYGQLYRWKRKQLIPDEWFIKKSTFTGQETFFPKEAVLARINKIKDMKEDVSLDNLADIFSPESTDVEIKREDIIKSNIVSTIVIDLYESTFGIITSVNFNKILQCFILEKLLSSGDASLDECRDVVKLLYSKYEKYEEKGCDIIILRKMGVAFIALCSAESNIEFEDNLKFVKRISVAAIIEELKLKMTNVGLLVENK